MSVVSCSSVSCARDCQFWTFRFFPPQHASWTFSTPPGLLPAAGPLSLSHHAAQTAGQQAAGDLVHIRYGRRQSTARVQAQSTMGEKVMRRRPRRKSAPLLPKVSWPAPCHALHREPSRVLRATHSRNAVAPPPPSLFSTCCQISSLCACELSPRRQMAHGCLHHGVSYNYALRRCVRHQP